MRYFFLIVILFISVPFKVSSQTPGWDQKAAFSGKVQKIRFWAYIEGDSNYSCYADAVNSIENALNHKGYEYKRLFYERRDTLSLQAWKARQIRSLSSNEAFLEVRVSVRADSIEWTDPSTVMVQDASGRVYAQHLLKPTTIKKAEYSSSSEALLFWPETNSDSGILLPFYSKKIKASDANVGNTAAISLKGIPVARHPAVSPKPAYLNNGGLTTFEFAFYGGYCAGATMSVTDGKAVFEPGADYGVEFNVDLYKGIYIGVGYKREDTFAKISSPTYPKEGGLPISNNYILISCIYRFLHSGMLQPYAGFDFGSVNMVMKDPDFRDVWYFAVGGRIGLCLYVSKVVGFRFQTQLLYQVHSTNAPFLYSDDYLKLRKSIDANSDLPQFDATFGLLIKLGK